MMLHATHSIIAVCLAIILIAIWPTCLGRHYLSIFVIGQTLSEKTISTKGDGTIYTEFKVLTVEVSHPSGRASSINGRASFVVSRVNPDDTLTGTLFFTVSENARERIAQLLRKTVDKVPRQYTVSDITARPEKKPKCPEFLLEFSQIGTKGNELTFLFQQFTLPYKETSQEASALFCKWANRLYTGRGHARNLAESINQLINQKKK